MDLTHIDVYDFFEDPTGNISHLTGDGHVKESLSLDLLPSKSIMTLLNF